MLEHEVIIDDPLGLHARPAARLVVVAGGFHSTVTLACRGSTADAKSILGVMTLAARHGDRVRIVAHGPDERAALEAVARLLRADNGSVQG